MKTTEQDRLYLSGAIHRMGERTGAAAERILDDLDTLLAENAKLRAEVAYLAEGRPLDAIRRTAAEMVKLRAVAEAARAAVDMVDEENERDALRRALAALEAP